MLVVENLYKSYQPKGEIVISGCGTSLIEKSPVQEEETDTAFAVNGLSFTLQKKEVVSMLGENGSGKSTLLKLLAGLMDVDAGRITLNAQRVTGPSENLVAGHARIKLIHQNYNLFPNISLRENIQYALRFQPKEYREKRLAELLELCHLEEVKEKLPRQASGGEQQRTAIATALATDTDILLLDEPFSNLDVFNKNELKKHIRKIADKGNVGVLFVTHDALDAMSVSDRISIIKKGKIIQTAKAAQLYNFPVNAYAANISGYCNIFDGKKLPQPIGTQNPGPKGKECCYIRPEYIETSTASGNGFAVKIRSCYYHGHYFVVEGITENRQSVVFYSKEALLIDSEIWLRFSEGHLHFFPSYECKDLKFGSAAYKETLALRDEILRKPLGLAFTPEELALEKEQKHLALYNHQQLVACLCLLPVGTETIKMRQVAVQAAQQGAGLGSLLVREAEIYARQLGFKRIILYARETVTGFYAQMGYHSIGKKFVEVGIPHQKMGKELY